MPRLRVILVEDNDADAKLLQRMLVGRFDVERARSIQELIEKSRSADPDIILLDLRLPDGGDYLSDVLRIVKRFYTTAVIVTTGVEDENLAFDTLKAGAQNYLVKGSFDFNRLHRIIQEAYARKSGELTNLPDKMTSAISSTGLMTPETIAKIVAKAVDEKIEKAVRRLKSDVHDVVMTKGQQFVSWIFKNWTRVLLALGLGGVYVGDVRPTTEASARKIEFTQENVKGVTEQVSNLSTKQKDDVTKLQEALIKSQSTTIKAFQQLQREIRALNPRANFPQESQELKTAKQEAEAIDIRESLFGED